MQPDLIGVRWRLGAWASAALLLCLLIAPAQAAVIQRVSVSTSGEQANGAIGGAQISPDGVYVVFESWAENLVPGDTNGYVDLLLRDRRTNTTQRVSVGSAGEQAPFGGGGARPAVNGHYVAFTAPGNSFAPVGTDEPCTFLRDLATGTTELVSLGSGGEVPNWSVQASAAVSADGRFVLFASQATNLVPGDTNGGPEAGGGDVFVRDRLLATTERVSVNNDGGQLTHSWLGDGDMMSDDGRYVLFEASATEFGAELEGRWEVVLRDRLLGLTEVVSLTETGEMADGRCWPGSISPDGRYIAFEVEEMGPDMIAAVFLRDRVQGTTERIDVTSTGESPVSADINGSIGGGVSADGRYVSFYSDFDELGPGGANEGADLFLRDRIAGTTTLLTQDFDGQPTSGLYGDWCAMSDDARHIVFGSTYDRLVPGDTNSDPSEVNTGSDIFVWDRDARFHDVASVFWSFPQIEACVNAGVVQGYGDSTYHPERNVTRDQMAVYIARALAAPTGDAAVPDGPPTATFEDVPNTGYGGSGTEPYWAYKYIEYCVAHDVVRGYDATHYEPLRVVDRGQMAVFIARAKGWVNIDDDMTTAPDVFPDVPAGYWSGTAIQACRDHGTVQGYGDNTYRPDLPVDRGQMAVYVARGFELDY